MSSTLAAKLGLKAQARACLIGAPAEVVEALKDCGATFSKTMTGSFAYLHAFFTSAEKLDHDFDKLARHLAEGGALWISWPKARQLETDLTLKTVIEIGYRHGLVESKTLGVDATWSAIKFTRPVPGKTYRNSYGKLPSA